TGAAPAPRSPPASGWLPSVFRRPIRTRKPSIHRPTAWTNRRRTPAVGERRSRPRPPRVRADYPARAPHGLTPRSTAHLSGLGLQPGTLRAVLMDRLTRSLGRDPDTATQRDIYNALSMAVREELAARWVGAAGG